MKKNLSLITLLVAIVTGAWANHSVVTDNGVTTETWDFAEYTTKVSIATGETETYGDLTFYGGGGSNKEEISTSGMKFQGQTQQWNSVWGRYIEYTPEYNGTITINVKGNGKSSGRYIYLATKLVKIASDALPPSGDDILAVSEDLGDGNNAQTDEIECSLTAGTTYYIEAYGGTQVNKIVYTYTSGSGKTALTGEWSNAAPEFAIGSTATIPTFIVTGGEAVLGTDYTVEYTKTDASDIVTLSGGNGVITSINTEAAATATVTATVTVENTTKYEMATTSYDCLITVADAKSASDLAVVSGKGTINTTVGADNYTLTQNTDFTTSSNGTISYTSSIPGVAYVNASTGELQFKGAGTTTITLTQAESAAYEGGSVTFTVNVLPTACLNLSDADEAITQLKKGWNFDSPYFDTENKLVIIGAFAAYSSGNGGYQKWIATSMNTDKKTDPDTYTVGGTSMRGDWSESEPFKGGEKYYGNGDKPCYATTNSDRPWTIYQFRIKGATRVQAYVQTLANASRYITMSAYEITGGALASSGTSDTGDTSVAGTDILSLDLDSSKEYLITVGNTIYASNMGFYEIAFTASASGIEIPSNRITTSAAGWASYTPMYNVSSSIYKSRSSSAATDIKMYTVESVTGSDATMHEVTSSTEKGMKADNGYFLKGAVNTVYRTTATNNNVTVPETNLIKAATETANVKSDASKTRYALLTYDADNYGLYKLNTTGVTMPAGKAYLEIDASSSNPASLDLQFDEATAISNVDANANVKTAAPVKVIKNGKLYIGNYNVAGQLVK